MVDGMAGDKPAVYIISLLPHQHIVYLYVIRIDCIQPGYVCCSIGKLAPQSDDGHADTPDCLLYTCLPWLSGRVCW